MFRHKFAFYHAWTLQNCIGGGMGGYLLSKRCVYRESRKENHQTVAQMKKFLLIILALMAKASVQAQDAFYIYQNDGHFDGFFYGQVQRISYSKVDTLGIEHNDYVSQEIVTEDSTYRIMLIAIDSVSFVQQEIIINPRVRILERDGLMPYFANVSDDHWTLPFSNDIPEALRPTIQPLDPETMQLIFNKQR